MLGGQEMGRKYVSFVCMCVCEEGGKSFKIITSDVKSIPNIWNWRETIKE